MFIKEQIRKEVIFNDIFISTRGSKIGQINALSVTNVLGHTKIVGQPSRITCLAYPGDGDFSDVENQVALSGCIHSV